MDLDELTQAFESRGYRSYPIPATRAPSAVVLTMQRRLDPEVSGYRVAPGGAVPGCLDNDDKIFVNITAHQFQIDESMMYSKVEFDITGAYREGTWIKLSVYSVGWDEAVKDCARFEQELLAAWVAVCKAGGR